MDVVLQLCQKRIWEQSQGAGDVRYLKGVGTSTITVLGKSIIITENKIGASWGFSYLRDINGYAMPLYLYSI